MYCLHLFGPLQLQDAASAVLKLGSRPIHMLALLALQSRPREDDYLCQLLWPQKDRATQLHSLGQAVYTLNRCIPRLITRRNRTVRVARDLMVTDLDLTSAALRAGDVASLITTVRGELLPDADRVSPALGHWAEAVRAEHMAPILRHLRGEFRHLVRHSQWEQILAFFQVMRSPLADDPSLHGIAIQAKIYCSEAQTLKRELPIEIKRYASINPAKAKRLQLTLKRRLHWDKREKIDHGPFVGRRNEIAVFVRQLEGARHIGFLTCIAGPIGAGRTRTAKQFGRIAAIRGSSVRIARLELGQPPVNYRRIISALRQLRSGRHVEGTGSISPHQIAQRASDNAIRPPVLIVDDLDWADQSCIQALAELISRLNSIALGIVVTAKDSSILRRLCAEVPYSVRCELMHLSVLGTQERQSLISWLTERYSLSEDEVELVDRLSDGNPRYAHGCARRIRALAGHTFETALAGELVQDSEQMPAVSQRITALVSYCEMRVDVRALAEVVELTPENISSTLQWLSDLGVLYRNSPSSVESGDKFVCEAVRRMYEEEDLRAGVMKLAKATLRFSRVDAARLAEKAHSLDEASRYYLIAAVQAIRFGAHADATSLLQHVLDIASHARTRIRAKYWLAEVHFQLRRYNETRKLYADLLRHQLLLPIGKRAVLWARNGQLITLADSGHAAAALEVIEKIPLGKIRKSDEGAIAEVLLASAAIAILSGSPDDADRVIERLTEEVENRLRNPRWLELAAALCKLSLITKGFAEALPLTNKCMIRARIAGGPLDLASSLVVRAITLTAAAELCEAEQLYAEAGVLIRDHALLSLRHIHGLNHAVALMEMGDFDAALDRLTALRATDKLASARYYQAFDDLNLATAHYEQGELDAAEYFAHETLRNSDVFPKREHLAATAILGLIAWSRGRVTRAVELAEAFRDQGQLGGDCSYGAMLRAIIMSYQGKDAEAVTYLLRTSKRMERVYRPASLRLLLAAAELESGVHAERARNRVEACARQAASSGMYSLVSRAAAALA